MAIQIVQQPGFTAVGLGIQTRPLSPEIPALWPMFASRMQQIPGQTEPTVSYGVMQHQPPDSLFYMAAVAVEEGAPVPAGMDRRVVPPGRYARFAYPLSRLAEGYGEIFNRLLPASGHVPAPSPMLERYGETFDPGDVNSLVEILVPLRG